MKADMEVVVDRGEMVSIMEPMLIGETSRHRGILTDLALEVAQRGLLAATKTGDDCRLSIVDC